MSLPTIVTDTDPVDGIFDCIVLDGTGASTVHAAVKLLICCPTVIATRCAGQLPPANRALIALSDTHSVVSAAVSDNRALALEGADATLCPITVTLTHPDAAMLLERILLGRPASIVMDAVNVLNCSPDVNTASRCVHTPEITLPQTELSDRHCVDASCDPPMRDRALAPASPTLFDTTVTLTAPDGAAFAWTTLLGPGALRVNAAVKLCACQLVMAAIRAAATPIADRATVAVSERQTVAVVAEPPWRRVSL